MLHFIQQGGYAMYLILLVGGLAVAAATRRAFRWAPEDATPLHLALLAFLIGVGGAGTGLYKCLSSANEHALPADVVQIGVMESLTPLILASMLAALAVGIDLGARTLLRRSGAPRV